ncbi:MAG: YiiX/YebB-like N1pC/P60 family cysteine hydrolase [Cocleimonas sp.]
MQNQLLTNSHRAYNSLSAALEEFKNSSPEQSAIDTAIERGYFIPEEDDFLWSLVSRFLTIRGGFWELIEEMSAHFSDDIYNVKSLDDWRYFLIGYASCCQAVSMARLLIDQLAKHKLVQRKINEGSPQNRIPRKVFTSVYESLSDTDNAIKMQYMMNFVDANREYINSLDKDHHLAEIIQSLPELEVTLHPSQLEFIKLRLSYLWHSITRSFAVGKQTSSFFILESAGRVIAEIGDHSNKRATPEIRTQAQTILKPGDVIVTRHDLVASNLFLPGYWPHTALYIGSVQQRDELGVVLDDSIENKWSGEINVLEAKKDGVLFRPLAETLAVDEFVILRPQVSDESLVIALSRVCQHAGKGYNFDFDFFRSDQLVCTEVIYRAFDGLEDIAFKLIERAGRFSLSAEDILDMTMDKNGFKVVAAFGFKGCESEFMIGDQVTMLVRDSY